MYKVAAKAWRQHTLLNLKQRRNSGFTLMELLVAIVMSSMVVSGLLYLVVELLRIDNRETALEEVQRDTQRAMNYMADELREAVYVYQGQQLADVTASGTGVGDALPAGSTPVLAFWKVSPISENQMPTADCDTAFPGAANIQRNRACLALRIRRASYNLVVYSQINGASDPWVGQSRISRYVLSQYADVSTVTQNPGYVDPGLQATSFEGWQTLPLLPGEELPRTSSVLVDHIAGAGASANPVDCQALTLSGSPNDYVLSPPNAPEDSSFFACIRDPNSITTVTQAGVSTSRSNQDVYLFLRGDTSGRSTSTSPASATSRSPMLQTQVLVRGLINKDPND